MTDHVRKVAITIVATFVTAGCDAPSTETSRSTPTVETTITDVAADEWLFLEPVSPERWEALNASIGSVRRLEFLSPDQPELDWTSLRSATSLERFRSNGPVGPTLFNALSAHERLRILNVPVATYDAASVDVIASLPRLESLRIGADRSHDDLIENVVATGATANRPLVHVHLLHGALGDAAVLSMANNPTLESLYLDDVEVSENALGDLVQKHGALHLHVNQLHLENDANKHPH